jgi:hypothetical protein
MLIYRDASTTLQVRLDGNTVWLSQRQIAGLYQTTPQNVTQHLAHIYEEGELDESATCKDYLQVQTEGARRVERAVRHYDLAVILAVGMRALDSRYAVPTARLSELLVKGFTMDDERIKAGRTLGADYFDELLARIRDIRSSERLFYQKIADIYAMSIDYDADAEATRLFYQTVQMDEPNGLAVSQLSPVLPSASPSRSRAQASEHVRSDTCRWSARPAICAQMRAGLALQ